MAKAWQAILEDGRVQFFRCESKPDVGPRAQVSEISEADLAAVQAAAERAAAAEQAATAERAAAAEQAAAAERAAAAEQAAATTGVPAAAEAPAADG